MRRRVRALPVMLVALFALIAIGAGNAGAAPAPKPAPVSTSGVVAGVLQVTPVGGGAAPGGASGLVVGLDPGTSAVRSFDVANRSAGLVLTVKLVAVNASRETGGAVHYSSSAAAGSPGTWLTLSDVVATLQPRAKLRVTVTVAPPVNAAPGEVLAGVVAQVDGAVRASDQATVAEHATATLPIAMHLEGAPTALVSIVGARLVDDHGRGSLEITFLNAGATANTMVGHVDGRGSAPRSVPIRAAVAALTHTTVRVPFALPSGAKTVPISVVAGDAGGDQATWSGSVGLTAAPVAHLGRSVPQQSAVRRLATTLAAHGASLPRLALLLVVLAFAAAALWFVAELRRNRAARRAITAAAVAPVAAPVDAPASTGPIAAAAPDVFYSGADEPMGAVALQLSALVEAIDRLVTRLGDGPEPQPEPAPAAGAAEEMAESGALLFAPASPRVPEASPNDLYDWPTEAQLEQFAARRRVASSDG